MKKGTIGVDSTKLDKHFENNFLKYSNDLR